MRTDGLSRGEVSAETAAVFGALMVMVFLVIGAASYSIASHVASVGALQGARSGSTVMGGGEAVFVAAAERVDTVVRELGSKLAHPPRVSVIGRSIHVVVTVRTMAPLGFLPGEVTRTATVPLEAYVREAER
jgi:hypothetical protein